MPESFEQTVERAPLAKKFLERFGAEPGWTTLLTVLGVAAFWMPEHITVFGTRFATSKVPMGIGVAVTASLFYWLGDKMNDWFWKKREKRFDDDDRFTDEALNEVVRNGGWRSTLWSILGIKRGITATSTPRRDAREWMGMKKGSYKVALRLAGAAGRDLDGGVYWPNEGQKALRSFVLPSVALGVILAIAFADWRYLALLALALVCFIGYVYLKFEHVRRLYVAVNNLKERGKVDYSDQPFKNGRFVRTFFLKEGAMVYAALPTPRHIPDS